MKTLLRIEIECANKQIADNIIAWAWPDIFNTNLSKVISVRKIISGKKIGKEKWKI